MNPMTNALKEKIAIGIKNGNDISDLVRDVDLRNVNLDRAIIKDFNCMQRDISGASFVHAIIGEEGKVTNFAHVIGHNCNFKYAKFLGKLDMRNSDFQGTNFCGASMINTDYRNANLLGCLFCGTIFSLSNWAGSGAKFDKKVFEMIFKHWGIEINQDTNESQESK